MRRSRRVRGIDGARGSFQSCAPLALAPDSRSRAISPFAETLLLSFADPQTRALPACSNTDLAAHTFAALFEVIHFQPSKKQTLKSERNRTKELVPNEI
jgi:hypothetical protein